MAGTGRSMTRMPGAEVDVAKCRRWFRRNRARSRAWFDLLTAEAYGAQPIALRHPLVFYEGHVAAFNVNTLVKLGFGRAGVDAQLEDLFERGIDPDEDSADAGHSQRAWPTRGRVLEFAAAADRLVEAAFDDERLLAADDPVLRRGLALHTILEHEAMHHETLLYMFHRLPSTAKHRPAGYRVVFGEDPPPAMVEIPAGRATLGADAASVAFAWDNELDAHDVDVAAFAIDVHDVTNREYLEFVEAGGYADASLWTPENWAWRERVGLEHPGFWLRRAGRWWWRALFQEVPLPLAWPVYVSHAEADAFTRWKGKRLPSEAEYHRAAFGAPAGERSAPWGEGAPRTAHGNFGLQHWDPVPVGSHPAGASAFGVHDLVGNGWEWTSTVFTPFPGFVPTPSYPRYSADFFDGGHYVMKGASPATAPELVRRSWRNWFRPRYPYPYATFRGVLS